MLGSKKACDMQNLSGKATDDLVCDYLLSYTNLDSSVYKFLEDLKKEMESAEKRNPLTDIELQISKATAEMDSLVNAFSQNKISPMLIESINKRAEELDAQLTSLKAEREQLLSKKDKLRNSEIEYDMTATALSSFKYNFSTLPIHEKRALIRLLIQKIEWNGQDLHIFLYGE